MSEKLKIVVTGANGQDGSLMCDYLSMAMPDSCEIYGVVRRSSNPKLENLEKAQTNENFHLVHADLADEVSINQLVSGVNPDYFINFAANSFVGVSWNMPMQTLDVNTGGVIRCLEAIRRFSPDCRFLNMGTSEEFGDVVAIPQTESHPQRPRSPYGASKASARHYVKVYRESYNLFAIQPWCFNHEGYRRGEEFVTRKITKGVGRFFRGFKKEDWSVEPIRLGNVDAKRDWSDARDFIHAIWMMLNPDEFFVSRREAYTSLGEKDLSFAKENQTDYVLSSNETHTVREFVTKAFFYAGINGEWEGEGLDEKFVDKNSGLTLVCIDPKFYRPAEVDLLLGDSTPFRSKFCWKPQYSFDALIRSMLSVDL